MKKVVLVTGASNGIGKKIAETFAENGYTVIINYNKSEDKAKKIVYDLCLKGFSAICLKADVTKFEQINSLINEIISIFGHIDVLVNNAGICSYNLLIDECIDSIQDQIDTNLLGTILCSQLVTKQMIKQNSGKIINISSIWGICGASGETIYSATKGGIIAFTKALAKELSYSGITVNAVAPGVVETDMLNHLNENEKKELIEQIPLKRFATPKEIADIVLFLASNKADYITGQTIQIDGGFSN